MEVSLSSHNQSHLRMKTSSLLSSTISLTTGKQLQLIGYIWIHTDKNKAATLAKKYIMLSLGGKV